MEKIEKAKINTIVHYKGKPYIRGQYERITKKYSLTSYDDSSKEKFVKKGTLVDLNVTF